MLYMDLLSMQYWIKVNRPCVCWVLLSQLWVGDNVMRRHVRQKGSGHPRGFFIADATICLITRVKIGDGVWSSRGMEVLLQTSFDNSISPKTQAVLFGCHIYVYNSNDGDGFPILRVGCLSTRSQHWCVLILLELFLYGIIVDPSAAKSWLLINQRIPLIVGLLSKKKKKKTLLVLHLSVLKYITCYQLQVYVFFFEHHQTLLIGYIFIERFYFMHLGLVILLGVYVFSQRV